MRLSNKLMGSIRRESEKCVVDNSFESFITWKQKKADKIPAFSKIRFFDKSQK